MKKKKRKGRGASIVVAVAMQVEEVEAEEVQGMLENSKIVMYLGNKKKLICGDRARAFLRSERKMKIFSTGTKK